MFEDIGDIDFTSHNAEGCGGGSWRRTFVCLCMCHSKALSASRDDTSDVKRLTGNRSA